MLPDQVSNPGPLTYESGALPIALRGPAILYGKGLGVCKEYIAISCVGACAYTCLKP